MRTAKTDQTGRMPRLICVFAGRTAILLVLSCHGSYLGNHIRKQSYLEYSYAGGLALIPGHMPEGRPGGQNLGYL